MEDECEETSTVGRRASAGRISIVYDIDLINARATNYNVISHNDSCCRIVPVAIAGRCIKLFAETGVALVGES